ncbi:MAG: thioredoxin family protein [Flavobacteriaceae bacterium CG_4_8_14_3_um_filter_34_10]|nr:thioredoxin family protein [Flavobacteriia bacterium]OIP49861.1 MAG: thiol-disulfide isomerase [Flavobacteriaceae bacterium CG2_30_34_30]PIQ18839.1 MAG: thiol-disulfide isomerase [Flavobacteriaceae bacterium CG18_big_fil_WC_8_21_14_2_50_34_36]PIV50979.1 MAG: thioredoxin family protein [Flavobacteriaceae bacterium CG02_land_8_20_14_3_00_34_13]PIX10512.1 MAG: thioredoxin family protein [Flavobacteriaceae bacterium CG_4_8_14_3_um_filter_34_10]PIZ07437.1 MAG: thioredoxin family protein [Flavoba
MKKIFYVTLLLLSINSIQAQDWKTDFEEAKSIAAKNNQNIVLVFQGSDWCAPCIKLDREIWSTDAFKNFSKQHFVMLKADFPRRKANRLSEEQTKKNALLAEKYNPSGYFPFVVVLNKDGKVLGETGYKKISPETFIAQLQSFEKK